MAIQIGRGSIPSLIDTSKRLVLQSPQSNLIQLYSETSNVFISYEGNGGPFQIGLSNSSYVITQHGAFISSYTSNAVYFSPDTYLQNTISNNVTASNVLIDGQGVVFRVGGAGSNVLTIRADTKSIGIGGITNPAESLHVAQNIRVNSNILTSNLIANMITPPFSYTNDPIIINGNARITGDMTLSGNLIYASDSQTQILSDIVVTHLTTSSRINISPEQSDLSLSIVQNQTQSAFGSNVIQADIETGTLPNTVSHPTFYVNPVGRVGVGTSAPSALLHLRPNDLTASTTSNLLQLDGFFYNPSTRVTSTTIVPGGANATSNIMVIKNSLHIGIGTATPSNVIHVEGNYGMNGLVYMTADRSNVFAINNGGWVGIGRSTPMSPLDISPSNITSTTPCIVNVTQLTQSQSNIVVPFLTLSVTSNVLLNVDAYGHINIGSRYTMYTSNSSTSDSTFGISCDSKVRFPLLETNTIRASPVPTTNYTSNMSLTWLSNFTSNVKYNYSNWLNVPASQYVIYSSNFTFSNVSTSNITYYSSGAVTVIQPGNTVALPLTLTTSNIPVGSIGYIAFNTPLASSNTALAGPTSNVVVTSNAGFLASNIVFEGTSLFGITAINTQSIVSPIVTASNLSCYQNITASNISVTSLTTNSIVISGLTVANDIATVSVNNFLFTGAKGMCLGGASNADLVTDPYTEGRLKVMLNGSPQVAGQISRAVTVYGNADVAVSVNTSWASGRPMIEFHNSTISTATYSRGLVGMDTSGNVFMGYKDRIEYPDYPKITLLPGGILFCNRMTYNSSSGRLAIGTVSGGFTPTQLLHVRGNVLVDTIAAGNAPALFVDTANLRVGINTSVPLFSNHIVGTQYVSGVATFGTNVTVSGTLSAANSILTTSDLSLKTDLTRIESALDKIDRLTGYVYTRKDTGRRETGLIAQDVQQVLPEAVEAVKTNTNSADTHLSVAYGNMLGLIVEAIKELRADVKGLRDRPFT
jgi:hypothetical protein